MTQVPTVVVGPRLMVDLSNSHCHSASRSFSASSNSSQPDRMTSMEATRIQQTLRTHCIAAPNFHAKP